MANIPISQLPVVTGKTKDDLMVLVQSGITSQISVENFFSEPYINAGNVGGALTVDLSNYKFYIFTLTGNTQVTLNNVVDGNEYWFWVYAVGAASVTSLSATGYAVYSVGGTLPNPANNAWNLYNGLAFDGVFVLTETGNFSQVP
jgi:hypothetical protein